MNIEIVITMFGIILSGITIQSVAIWTKISKLGEKIAENKCPFSSCPLYERAKAEAVEKRDLQT